MLIPEGVKISADGEVLQASDLCADESFLTGEADVVWKGTVQADAEEHSFRFRIVP